jgi:hypothetical protein
VSPEEVIVGRQRVRVVDPRQRKRRHQRGRVGVAAKPPGSPRHDRRLHAAVDATEHDATAPGDVIRLREVRAGLPRVSRRASAAVVMLEHCFYLVYGCLKNTLLGRMSAFTG